MTDSGVGVTDRMTDDDNCWRMAGVVACCDGNAVAYDSSKLILAWRGGVKLILVLSRGN